MVSVIASLKLEASLKWASLELQYRCIFKHSLDAAPELCQLYVRSILTDVKLEPLVNEGVAAASRLVMLLQHQYPLPCLG